MQKENIPMVLSKSTPGTHVYRAREPEGVTIKTLYVQRDGLPKSPPKAIKVTVEYDE
jgi:hypothetical protein